MRRAKPAAEFVKMLCESGEKVLLFGWHREVYDIWKYHLKNFNPVLCTGSETPAQKQAAKDKFLKDGSCQVFICSLRSGAGIDGLQDVCHLAVFGELDWSPQVLDQCIGRLRPELNKEEILAYFLTIDDGADPFMIERLGDKRSQSDGIIDGKDSEGEILEDGPPADRIRQMAEAYLMLIGEEIPVAEPQSGLHAEVASALRKIKLPSSSEREMQEAIWAALPGLVPDALVEREYRIGERGRLDFLVTSGSDSIAVECKIDQTGRGSVYRQVRRYIEEADVSGVVILAPWSGVSNFVVEDVPVTVVDWAKAKI